MLPIIFQDCEIIRVGIESPPHKFNIEIITPDKTLIKSEISQAIIPAFEGSMTILKDHISIVTFLRPGFIEVISDKSSEKFYAEAIQEGLAVGVDLSREERESHYSQKGLVILFYS